MRNMATWAQCQGWPLSLNIISKVVYQAFKVNLALFHNTLLHLVKLNIASSIHISLYTQLFTKPFFFYIVSHLNDPLYEINFSHRLLCILDHVRATNPLSAPIPSMHYPFTKFPFLTPLCTHPTPCAPTPLANSLFSLLMSTSNLLHTQPLPRLSFLYCACPLALYTHSIPSTRNSFTKTFIFLKPFLRIQCHPCFYLTLFFPPPLFRSPTPSSHNLYSKVISLDSPFTTLLLLHTVFLYTTLSTNYPFSIPSLMHITILSIHCLLCTQILRADVLILCRTLVRLQNFYAIAQGDFACMD